MPLRILNLSGNVSERALDGPIRANRPRVPDRSN